MKKAPCTKWPRWCQASKTKAKEVGGRDYVGYYPSHTCVECSNSYLDVFWTIQVRS